MAIVCHQLSRCTGGGSSGGSGLGSHAFSGCQAARRQPLHGGGVLASGLSPPPARASRRLVVRPHGPEGPLDWLIERLVPQPGPQWVPPEPPEELQDKPLPPEAVEGVDAEELAWREFLVALVPYAERLADQVDAAEKQFLMQPDDGGSDAATALPLPGKRERAAPGVEATAERAVFRSVWANLGDAREAVRTLQGRSRQVARSQAWRGDFAPPANGFCPDILGLEGAIVTAWTAKCDPEYLWPAQALLGACRRYTSSTPATAGGSDGQLVQD